MTPIERSNNLAQRNVAIEREPVTSPTFLFAVADTRRELIVDAKLDRDRRAFLHFPKTAARLWQNQGRRLVPPTQRTVPIRTGRRLRTTRTHIRPRAAEAGADVAPLIVDSTDAGVPSASEFITVRQKGRSGFRIQLNRSGFRDSFEWGLARGWHAMGRWNVVDRNVDRCALSRLGRRAAGFAGRRGRRLPSGRHDGNLTSPQFTVPRRRGPVGVTFFHRSSGPNAPGTNELRAHRARTRRRPHLQTKAAQAGARVGPLLFVRGGPSCTTSRPHSWTPIPCGCAIAGLG
jgi:hypothetical protein